MQEARKAHHKISAWGVIFSVPFCLYMLPAKAQQYRLTDLGTLGGSTIYGSGINNAGQVTGTSYTAGKVAHAFLYSSGVMSDLGTLGGSYSYGREINNAGQVTGFSYTAGVTAPHAFLYSKGLMNNLGTLGGSFTYGVGINNAGQVSGYTSNSLGSRAFLYSSGVMSDLGTLGGSSSVGYGINDAGQVTGWSFTAGPPIHAFLYGSGVMSDLGTLGGSISAGTRINNAGQVTGYSYTSGDAAQHAFLYSKGVMNDLGTLGGSLSDGSGINNAEQVTGTSDTAGNTAQHAFLYSGGVMKDLNSLIDPNDALGPYVILTESKSINDDGWIVANGHDARTGQDRAYLVSLPPPLIAFAYFYPQLDIRAGDKAGFDLHGFFTLGSSSKGIDPLTEPVKITVGSYTVTIPAGSFTRKANQPFKFDGILNGVTLKVKFVPLGGMSFGFDIKGDGVELTGSTRPVHVELTIGKDSGKADVTASSDDDTSEHRSKRGEKDSR